MMKIYIGCSITSVPKHEVDHFKLQIHKLKDILRAYNFEIVEFLSAIKDGTPEEVYVYDIKKCIDSVDVMLAICDYPSTGLGYEMASAIEKRGIPVFAVAREPLTVSKLIRGISHPKFKFDQYDSIDDIPVKLKEFLSVVLA